MNDRATAKPIGLLFKQTIEGIVLGQRLSEPYGITSDMLGNIYLVDAGNDRLLKFDREYQPMKETGGYGSDAGLLNSPTYLFLSNNLNLYVSDAGNRRIAVYDSRLNYARSIDFDDPEDPSKYGHMTGLRVNEYGEIWVADKDRSRIWIFNSIGTYDRSIGGIESTGGFLLNPAGISEETNGQILVCDQGNGLIKVYDSFGIFNFEFGNDNLKKPSGAAVDTKGNIWVADSGRPGLLCFDPSGNLLFTTTDFYDNGDAKFYKPVDLTVLPGNRLIVSDIEKNQLLIFQILYP